MGTSMRLEVLADPAAVAARGAAVVAETVLRAVGGAGTCALAVSGGRTPWTMFEILAGEDLQWDAVAIWQVDERIAADGHPDRNLTGLASLLPPGASLHPMPVSARDLEAGASRYAASLPPYFDLVHLGLGDDGHTASLVPGDAVLDVTDRDVALTGEYRGRRRMTLTFPALSRARLAMWLVTGVDKVTVLPRLLRRDPSIPAGRVPVAEQLVLADGVAAAGLER